MAIATSMGVGQYAASAPTEQHVIFTDRLYKPNASRRLVVWCHSAGGNALEPFIPTNNALPLVRAIASDLGAPIIACDFGGQAWGNDAAQARIDDAVAYANATVKPKTDKIVLLGVSMGGMLSLNYLRANPSKVAAAALLYPAVDLQWMHDNGAAASTEAAYGGSTASFNAAVASHNPIANASAYSGKPITAWYSDSDAVVSSARQASFLSSVGTIRSRLLKSAGHADMTKIPVKDLAAFLRAYV